MSGKKWGLCRLARFQQKIRDDRLLGTCSVGIGEIPITWNEFNKMYFSSRPVVVECPCTLWQRGDQLMGFYAALRQLFAGRKVGFFSTRYDVREETVKSYCNSIGSMASGKSRNDIEKNPVYLIRNNPSEEVLPRRADDWIMYAFGANPSQAQSIMDIVDETDGFKKWDEDKYRIKSSWEMGPRKKVIILAGRGSGAIGAIDIYPKLKEKYGDRFVFLDYCHEKEIVDGWFLENEKVLDPMFDIMISESSIDKRKVFSYIATNHLYKLREYNKLFPEEVAKWLTDEERKELRL